MQNKSRGKERVIQNVFVKNDEMNFAQDTENFTPFLCDIEQSGGWFM